MTNLVSRSYKAPVPRSSWESNAFSRRNECALRKFDGQMSTIREILKLQALSQGSLQGVRIAYHKVSVCARSPSNLTHFHLSDPIHIASTHQFERRHASTIVRPAVPVVLETSIHNFQPAQRACFDAPSAEQSYPPSAPSAGSDHSMHFFLLPASLAKHL